MDNIEQYVEKFKENPNIQNIITNIIDSYSDGNYSVLPVYKDELVKTIMKLEIIEHHKKNYCEEEKELGNIFSERDSILNNHFMKINIKIKQIENLVDLLDNLAGKIEKRYSGRYYSRKLLSNFLPIVCLHRKSQHRKINNYLNLLESDILNLINENKFINLSA